MLANCGDEVGEVLCPSRLLEQRLDVQGRVPAPSRRTTCHGRPVSKLRNLDYEVEELPFALITIRLRLSRNQGLARTSSPHLFPREHAELWIVDPFCNPGSQDRDQ